MYRNGIKRLLAIVLSLCGMVCLSWLFLILAVAIKLDSPGPVFFKQKRVGLGKKHFYILKFRTMRIDTPHDMPTHLLHDPDQYITRMGHFLRKTSLDELPQIWDIFTGKLSVIGPRPLVETETYRYYGKRDALLSVKPGLTGYWQAYARNDVGYGDGRRQEMELYYVANRSVWTDIKIFFKTIGSVVKRKGAR